MHEEVDVDHDVRRAAPWDGSKAVSSKVGPPRPSVCTVQLDQSRTRFDGLGGHQPVDTLCGVLQHGLRLDRAGLFRRLCLPWAELDEVAAATYPEFERVSPVIRGVLGDQWECIGRWHLAEVKHRVDGRRAAGPAHLAESVTAGPH